MSKVSKSVKAPSPREYILNDVPEGFEVVNSRNFVAVGPEKIKGKLTGMQPMVEGYIAGAKWRAKRNQAHILQMLSEGGSIVSVFANTIIERYFLDVQEKVERVGIQDGKLGVFYRVQYVGEGGKAKNRYHNVLIMRSKTKEAMPEKDIKAALA